jgi:hypothetical protein
MAAVIIHYDELVSEFHDILQNNNEELCQRCAQLISVKSELKSAKEIISILKEELEVTYTRDQKDEDSFCIPDNCSSTQQQPEKQISESKVCIKKISEGVGNLVLFNIPRKNRFEVLCNNQEEIGKNSSIITPQGTYKQRARNTGLSGVKVRDKKSTMSHKLMTTNASTKFKCPTQQSGVNSVKHSVVVLIGNSHSRGCASKIKKNLPKNFEVIGYVKPRANNSFLKNTVNNLTKQLKKNYIVIYWGKNKNIRDLYRGINEFKRGYQPRSNVVKDEKGDLVVDSHSILARWRNHFSQLLNIHGVNDVRQIEVHTAEPLVPEPSAFEVEMAIGKLKSHKSPGTGQIPAKLIKAGGRIIRSEIHKLIVSIWNKEELPEEWKESVIVPIYKKGDKTDRSNY